MIASATLIAFLATTKPAESLRFYEEIIGLRFVADEPFALVFDSNGTMLRISKVQDFTPAPFTVLGWIVSDIGSEVSALVDNGVSFEVFEGLVQDGDGICTFPDRTMVAWFRDPDGNTLSLTQFPHM